MQFSKPLTVAQAAAALGCSETTVRELCRSKQLKAYTVSRQGRGNYKTWRITPEAIKEYRERGY